MSRFTIAFCFCLALAGCASAPEERDSNDPYLMVQRSPTQLPMVPVGNRQWQVRAELNGVPGVFEVDTGSDATIITPQFAEKLGLLKTAVKGRVSGLNPLHQQLRFAKLIYLRLGGLLYVNFYVPILNLDHLNRATHTQLDGILGNNILGKTACVFDWKNNLLTLDADAVARPANAFPIESRKYLAHVTALVNGQPADFVLDTGAYSSSITEADVRWFHIPDAKKSAIEMPRADIAEISPLQQTQIALDTFTAGQISRTNFPLLTWHDNVMGMDLLEPWVLTLDANAGWFSLAQPSEPVKR